MAEYDGASSSAVMMGAVTGAMGRLMHHPRPSMLAEYEPEFGSDDTPSSQLEELPRELGSCERGGFFERGRGDAWDEDRGSGGGFDAMRERRRGETEAAGGGGGEGTSIRRRRRRGARQLSGLRRLLLGGRSHPSGGSSTWSLRTPKSCEPALYRRVRASNANK